MKSLLRSLIRWVSSSIVLATAIVVGLTSTALSQGPGNDTNPTFIGSWPGFSRGGQVQGAHGVAAVGNYAYVAAYDAGLHIMDVSDPAAPKVVAGVRTFFARRVVISGDHAYIADDKGGLKIVNVQDPENPVGVGVYEFGFDREAWDVAIQDNYAYVAFGLEGLVVVDVSNPARPVKVGQVPRQSNWDNIAVKGNYAFLGGGSLDVIDISNPSKPVLEKRHENLSSYGMAIRENLAYVASGRGLTVLDISNPAELKTIGTSLASIEGVSVQTARVSVAGDRAFVMSIVPGALTVFDISDPAKPTKLSALITERFNRDLAVAGNHVYIANDLRELQVIDVSDPAEPSLAGTYQPSAASSNNIAVQDSNVYVADGVGGIQVIDISDRSNPTRIGGLDDLGSVSNVALSIHSDPSVIPPFAVVITGGRHNIGSTLRFIDISNPTVLFEWETSSLQLTGLGRGIVARGGMAYVADSVEGLVIVRAQNPRFREPSIIGSKQTRDEPRGIDVLDNYAYVVIGNGGLQVIDLSDLSDPQTSDYIVTEGMANAVAVQGHYAFIASSVGLEIIDVRDPEDLTFVASLPTKGTSNGVAIQGHFAYLVDSVDGVRVIDVRNPSDPKLAGGSLGPGFDDRGGSMNALSVWGDHAYVAAGDYGLQVFSWISEEPIVPDPELRAAIRRQLGKGEGELTRADLESLTELKARPWSVRNGTLIKSLEGIQHAINLETLDLAGAVPEEDDGALRSVFPTISFAPLKVLGKLASLDLSFNYLTISKLPDGLTSLVTLDLSSNFTSSLVLPSGLTNLQELVLRWNQLRNVGTDELFRHELPNLKVLDLSNNGLSELSLPSSFEDSIKDGSLRVKGIPVSTITYYTPPILGIGSINLLPGRKSVELTIVGPKGVVLIESSTDLNVWSEYLRLEKGGEPHSRKVNLDGKDRLFRARNGD